MSLPAPPVGRARRGPVDKRLLRRARSARHALCASVGIGLVATASIAAQALLLARLIASVFPGASLHPSRLLLVEGIGASTAVRAACAWAGELVARLGSARVKAELRRAVLLRSLRPGQRPIAAGELATLAGRGLDALDVYIGKCMPDLVLAFAAPALLLVVLGLTDWLSAVVVLVALGLFPVFGMLVGWATRMRARERWVEISALGDHLVDLFEGLAVLRAFGRSADERKRIAQMGEQLRRTTLGTLKLALLSALVLDTLASISTALVAVPIGIRLVYGSMRLGSGLAVLLLTPEVFLPLRRASAEFHESAEGLAAAANVLDLLDDDESDPSLWVAGGCDTLAGAPDPTKVTVSLQDVTVVRPGRARPVLAHAEIDLAPGETVVLVGANGAGKSTVIALLLGLITPSGGRIVIGDRSLGEIDPRAWREMCSLLPELPTLLPATIEENVRISAPNADAATLQRALADAHCMPLIDALPLGLATTVGEGGWALSRGECQRVAIARTFLRDAGLYLLDEPTAHLDPASELLVVERLRERLCTRTALIVTHRSAVISLADRVLLLSEGVVVEVDPKDGLVSAETGQPGGTLPPRNAPDGVIPASAGAFA